MTSFDCLCIDCDIRIDQGLFFHVDASWESKIMRIFLFKWTAISNGQQFLIQKQKPVPIKLLNLKFEEK